MISIIAKIKAQEGKEEELKAILLDLVEKVKSEEGTLEYILNQSTKDKTQFIFYEKYKDQDALTFHSSTPYFKEAFPAMKPFLGGKTEIEMCQVLGSK